MKTICEFLVVLDILLLVPGGDIFSQVGINSNGSSPDASSMLDVKSTDKGMLIPRMTQSQRNAITPAAVGLLVFQTDAPAGFYYYNGTSWTFLVASGDGYFGNVIDIDGNGYRTIKIGTQEWMGENLSVTHYRNGNPIDYVTDPSDWSALLNGAYCWYDNDPGTNQTTYGALYNWYAVTDSRNLCPTGWHAPTDGEWNTLVGFLGGTGTAGAKMKAVLHWFSSSWATNTSGFSGLPGGYRNNSGDFIQTGFYGVWWTSTDDAPYARQHFLESGTAAAPGTYYSKAGGFSVRCVRD